MASGTGKKSSSGRRNNGGSNAARNRSGSSAQRGTNDSAIYHEIGLIIVFAVAVLLFLCNFNIVGPIGNQISNVMFGLFGICAYVVPIAAFIGIAFYSINQGNRTAVRKVIAGVVLFFIIGIIFELFQGPKLEKYDIREIYAFASAEHKGGGAFAGSLEYFMYHFLDTVGTVLLVIVLAIICLVLLTERSFVNGVKNGSRKVVEKSREDAKRRKEYAQVRRQEQEEARQRREEERRLKAEEAENEKILRMDKKVSGVMLDTALAKQESTVKAREDIHEIVLNTEEEANDFEAEYVQPEMPEPKQVRPAAVRKSAAPMPEEIDRIQVRGARPVSAEEEKVQQVQSVEEELPVHTQTREEEKKSPKKYMFPPLSRLQKGSSKKTGESERELKETALHLQQTLRTFGVNVTITDISQGPSVTRYELQPEQGVKVSKIVGLADDIKLNLAATDIRIEAPIPGKAAIGIEVPNKENAAVALRDLLETKEFKEFPSNLAFAVGKDIAGQTVVADIAKMPHMLIAGATGSGKSVCINTLIMSILYKAHPDDVKLIMIDPKVVELSVYNGIPHLLIPVVTDPKKAAGALHWGVSEMTDRYKKFADFNVRDLKGYNKKVEDMREAGEEAVPEKMPQVVIIVDELADLMMVAPGEVEESICRLAQLARAAGIHLIIATQRPSVDVITGLIKANMPSRVAFSVSSGVDSRTILDMNGAEKLLGKGDMLFYPQGYSKPARIQGAFVSDKEVADVVDFLKNQTLGNTYAEDIEEKIKNIGSSSGGGTGAEDKAEERDAYFADAGRFIIEKDKASIGMLQRVFKIGFNRAARIMDQLCDYGVVGEEEGTKPRKVLMSAEEFERLLEEI